LVGAGDIKSGFVCVTGRPNVGKSTLVNGLVGTKVAIVSDKPQTTRGAVRGIATTEEGQLVLVDTPGYHKPRNLLGRRLNEVVRSAWNDVDLALFVLDARAGVGSGDERLAADLKQVDTPKIAVVNKIDASTKVAVIESLAAAGRLSEFDEIIPVSARTGEQVDLLRELIFERMPQGPLYYPGDMSTDQPPPAFVAELVREKLLARTRDELPHSIAVVVEDYDERDDGLLEISARIFVERESQKGIVIGRGGSMLKEVGTDARLEIETLFGRSVFLDLRVKVEKDWQRRDYALDRLGFTSGD
jgi:GTP-binding protein Era